MAPTRDANDGEMTSYRNTRPIPDPTELTNDLVAKANINLRQILETRILGLEQRINQSDIISTRHIDISIGNLQATADAKILANKDAIQVIRDDIEKRFQVSNAESRKNAADIKEAVDTAFLSASVITKAGEQLQDEKIRAQGDSIAVFKNSMAERFDLLEKQTIKAAADVKSAVDAAFAASASGVAQQNQANFLASQKQEAAFTKQIDQLAANVAQISKANDDKLNDLKKINDDKFGDLKDRLVAMEGRSSISDPTTAASLRDMANAITALKTSRDEGTGSRQQRSDMTAWIFSAIAAACALGFLAIDIFRTH